MGKSNDNRPVPMIVPPEKAVGVPANLLTVFHNPTDFILDFGMAVPPSGVALTGSGKMDAQVVLASRVVIPAAMMPSVLKAVEGALENYKREFGDPTPKLLKQGEVAS